MSMWSSIVQGAAAAGLCLLAMATGAAAEGNVCADPNVRQACSFQCCGRRSCPPSCEVDCVKLCVDGCSSQSRSLAYNARKRELQIRCGHRGAR